MTHGTIDGIIRATRGLDWRRLVIASLPCVIGILFAARDLQQMAAPDSGLPQFTDAITYLAAGERLNSGHALYFLGPGDRPVVIVPEISMAALLSPPPIAVIWRPIAAVPFGFAAWMVAVWAALLGTSFYLVYRTGLRGAIVATALAPAIGEQLAAGNVAAFFPLLLTLAWYLRDRPVSGALIGLMASIKLAPAAMGGWLLGTRAWQSVAAATGVGLAAVVISIVGAGPSSIASYLDVARTVAPSPSSLSGLSGVPWLTPAVLVGGTLLAIGLGSRPSWSFTVAVVVSIIGTPALYLSGLVTLLAVLAPVAERAGRARAVGTIGELPVHNALPD